VYIDSDSAKEKEDTEEGEIVGSALVDLEA